MKGFYYLFFLISFTPFCVETSILTEKLSKGKYGDYVVYQVDKWIHCLHVLEVQKNILKFEEITIPVSKKPMLTWKNWKNQNAPGHTAWNVYTLDIEKGKIISAYDAITLHHFPTDDLSSFIVDLMRSTLNPTPMIDRKKIGPEPLEGLDTRSLWNPPCYFFGKKVKKPEYDVYSARWKNDDTPLTGKIVDAYFLHEEPSFPFPVWIQIRDSADTRFNIIELDAGR